MPYYLDVYDELFHISELAHRYTDSLTGILQVYLNMSSNQTCEIIKYITLFTVITTPITIVGMWHGMNFEGSTRISMEVWIPDGYRNYSCWHWGNHMMV